MNPRILPWLFVAGCGVWAVACDDPTATREPFHDPALMVILALDPDTARQYMMLLPAGGAGAIEGPSAEVWRDSELVAVNEQSVDPRREFGPCADAFGSDMNTPGGEKRCLHIHLRPQEGATYEVVIRAADRPTARALTTVPGAFDVTTVEAAGDPPGTERLKASWTGSDGADRYFVGVHADQHPYCHPSLGCDDLFGGSKNFGWQIAVRDTTVTTRVSDELVAGGEGSWHFRVVALDRALADHLTTGSPTRLFPILPISNVEGGLGVVGSWVSRTVELAP